MYTIGLAIMDQLSQMDALIRRCTADLLARGLYQWDDAYPSAQSCAYWVDKGELYVLCEEEHVRGLMALSEQDSDDWWPGVRWHRQSGRYLTVHSLAIDPPYQRQGYGHAMLAFWEKVAHADGYDGVRLDVFSENEGALRFYEQHGYARMGEFICDGKPEGHQLYYCYEKVW